MSAKNWRIRRFWFQNHRPRYEWEVTYARGNLTVTCRVDNWWEIPLAVLDVWRNIE